MANSPKPWKVAGQSDGGKYIKVVDTNGKMVARVPFSNENLPLDQITDNDDAHLIANAPNLKEQRDELLAALKELRESETAFRALPPAPTYEYGQAEKRYRAARADADAAIARVEGQ